MIYGAVCTRRIAAFHRSRKQISLRSVSLANCYLAELKCVSESISNQSIVINALALQEAKDSSEIENIITTHDEMYKAELDASQVTSSAAKEVQSDKVY